MDYLLKPVARRELEEALRKTQDMLEERSAAKIFKEDRNEFEELFRNINEGREFDREALYELFSDAKIDLENKFFAGICIGLMPQAEQERENVSSVQNDLQRFSLLSRLCESVREEGIGFVLKRDENCLHIIGVFDRSDSGTFYEKYVHPIRVRLEQEFSMKLCIGIGMRTEDASMLKNVYKTARFAYDLYFFEEKPVIDFEDIHKDYNISFEDYRKGMEEVFRSIISKDGSVLKNVDRQLNLIEQIHYGNSYAVKSRVMLFTGDLGMRLCNYKAYLTGIRMEEALRLLLNTDLKTYEIGERVGYNNVRRFVDAFKQRYGMSPMDYKRKHYREEE